jgi:NAD(P)-dependent dehydrogenase (short-subunit alcohol dehydrogenase family)
MQMKQFNRANRNIVITGCSSGIGLDAAIRLHKLGYRVIATLRNVDGQPVLQQLGIDVVLLDYGQQSSIDSAVTAISKLTNKSVYALFNNGAYGQVGALEDLATEDLRAQFETNFFGWHSLTKAVIPWMRQAGEGRIIQCSSVLGIAAYPYRGAYNSSKYALEGYTDTLRVELQGTGIQLSLIEPGPIHSRFRLNALTVFNQNINQTDSPHQQAYATQVQRLLKPITKPSMALPPSAVTDALIHAIEHKRAKIRYRVTRATKIVSVLKRILPDRLFDKFVAKTV